MNRTRIEWVRNPDGSPGYTWNARTGCLGPNGTPEKPKRCPYCYAHKLANGRLRKRYLSASIHSIDSLPRISLQDPFAPRLWLHRIGEPYHVKKPSTIFVCSMGELFSEYYPAFWLVNILRACGSNPRHTFLVLTKNPPRDEHLCLPRNVWFGVSINKGEDWLRLRIAEDPEATKRFISFEPLLDDVMENPRIQLVRFDWVIIGAQTKPYKPPKIEWVEHIISEADLCGIPVFLKNNLKPLMGENLRQEFPEL